MEKHIGPQNIECEINQYDLNLGMSIEAAKSYIRDSSTKKIGVLMKRIYQLQRGEKGFFSWGCKIKFWGHKILPDPTGTSFQTSAGIIFRSNKLVRFQFNLLACSPAVVREGGVVREFGEGIRDKAFTRWGATSLLEQPTLIAETWEDEETRFQIQYHENVNVVAGGTNNYMLFGYK